MLWGPIERSEVRHDVKGLLGREEGIAHIVLLVILLAAFLIAFGMLIGYAIWGK